MAGKAPEPSTLVDVHQLVTAYYAEIPDPSVAGQRIAFGTSGHRGSAFAGSFNERHVVAIARAMCEYRKRRGVDGALFLGMDTHALSVPACASTLELRYNAFAQSPRQWRFQVQPTAWRTGGDRGHRMGRSESQ